jgi:hypothetical protein
MTSPIAYATLGIDGDVTMLWLPDQLAEARTYCAEGEEPIALGRLMVPPAAGLRRWTLLLTSAHHGLVGQEGHPFRGSPEFYERVTVQEVPHD